MTGVEVGTLILGTVGKAVLNRVSERLTDRLFDHLTESGGTAEFEVPKLVTLDRGAALRESGLSYFQRTGEPGLSEVARERLLVEASIKFNELRLHDAASSLDRARATFLYALTTSMLGETDTPLRAVRESLHGAFGAQAIEFTGLTVSSTTDRRFDATQARLNLHLAWSPETTNAILPIRAHGIDPVQFRTDPTPELHEPAFVLSGPGQISPAVDVYPMPPTPAFWSVLRQLVIAAFERRDWTVAARSNGSFDASRTGRAVRVVTATHREEVRTDSLRRFLPPGRLPLLVVANFAGCHPGLRRIDGSLVKTIYWKQYGDNQPLIAAAGELYVLASGGYPLGGLL